MRRDDKRGVVADAVCRVPCRSRTRSAAPAVSTCPCDAPELGALVERGAIESLVGEAPAVLQLVVERRATEPGTQE
eukprot:1817557-Prymnesium_polylepis.1